jgi:CRP/FNR family transcriptional regulator
MVETLSFRSVVSRMARLLADMAVAEKGPAPVPRLTQDEMAAMVGSVRDVVGRALKHLEKAGAIKIEGHRILVVSLQKLKGLAE